MTKFDKRQIFKAKMSDSALILLSIPKILCNFVGKKDVCREQNTGCTSYQCFLKRISILIEYHVVAVFIFGGYGKST